MSNTSICANTAIALSINLNKIALLRNSREGQYPCVVSHGEQCIQAGCHGLTVHPRPDQRHIRPSDVYDLAALCHKHPSIEFNIEGNADEGEQGSYPGFMALVLNVKPDQCTLVPDSQHQLTSDHGFDLTKPHGQLIAQIQELQANGIRVSLFMDPDIQQIELAKATGADRIELYTGPYAAKYNSNQIETLFEQYATAANYASSIGLGVNAGHDLNLVNLAKFASIPSLQEVSIGHAFTVDAIQMGLANCVEAYLSCLNR